MLSEATVTAGCSFWQFKCCSFIPEGKQNK